MINKKNKMDETNKTNAGQAFGIVALISGILSFIIAFIPCIKWLALILGVAGLIFGIVGLIQAKRGNGPKGMNIAGISAAGVGLIIVIIWYVTIFSATSGAFSLFKNGFKDAMEEAMEGKSDEDFSWDDLGEELEDAFDEMEDELENLEVDMENFDIDEPVNEEDFNKLLSDYEDMILEYEELVKKAEGGDLSVVSSYTKLAAKTMAIATKLSNASMNMTAEQVEKFSKLQQKYDEVFTDNDTN